MGITEVECVIVEMDEDKEKALNVALNKISGEWDNNKLALIALSVVTPRSLKPTNF